MRLTSKNILFIFVAAFALLYSFFLSPLDFFVSARLKTIDHLYTVRARSKPASSHLNDIVLIGVDDESFQKLDRSWPWGREVFAIFLEKLQSLNPKISAFDLSLAGHGANAAADRWLADEIAKKRNVILASYFTPEGRYMTPLKEFALSSKAGGFVDKPVDRDGIIRHFHDTVDIKGSHAKIFSLAEETAHGFLGLPPTAGPESGNKSSWLSFRYRPENFKYYPFWKIITGAVPRSEVEGKIVLVGVVSPLFHDIHETPLGAMAGVFINANETIAILDAETIHEEPTGLVPIFYLSLALVSLWLFLRFDWRVKTFVWLGIEVTIYVIGVYLFSYKNILIDLFSPMLLVTVSYLAVMMSNTLATFLENIALQQMVTQDGLTGLYVYRYLTLRLEAEFNRARRQKNEICCVMVDIDYFKRINDTYGHEEGNRVLVTIANILKHGVRGYDVVARYGGEEFCIILVKNNLESSLQVIERIRKNIEMTLFSSSAGDFQVTISAGICSSTSPGINSKEDFLRLTDEAMYQAKSEGRNRVCVYKTSIASP